MQLLQLKHHYPFSLSPSSALSTLLSSPAQAEFAAVSACSLHTLTSHSGTSPSLQGTGLQRPVDICRESLPLLPGRHCLGSAGSPLGLHGLWPPFPECSCHSSRTGRVLSPPSHRFCSLFGAYSFPTPDLWLCQHSSWCLLNTSRCPRVACQLSWFPEPLPSAPHLSRWGS